MSLTATTAPLRRFARRAWYATFLGFLIPTAGCMIAPLDGRQIATKNSKIHCLGATFQPNEMVHVEAWNWLTNNWDIIDHAYTGTSSVNAHGYSWRLWTTSVQVPEFFYWQSDEDGEYVLIRSVRFEGDWDYDGDELPTFESWSFSPETPLIDFYNMHGTGTTHAKVYLK
ncbi:MAG: hypothetical protein QGG36_00955 [Pirellulaceae bacterium]|jgi:hypothetical protein|nr:hypothetical protein [Pirellulaceae bacterium]MDP7014345.1 hypothetical protein [Pirellulaceae bacterium]